MINITISEKELYDNLNSYQLGEYVKKKFHEQWIENNSFDKCIICGEETPYLKSTHINERIGYVDGSGQSCYQPNFCNKI